MPPGYSRARRAYGASRSQGKSGRSSAGWNPPGAGSVLVDLRREGGYERVILVDLTDLGGTTG